MAYRDADTKRFTPPPDLARDEVQRNLANARAAKFQQNIALQEKRAAEARARAQQATNNGKPNLRGQGISGYGTQSTPLQINTPSGGRASISRPLADQIGVNADVTRQVIAQRQAAEVQARAAQADAEAQRQAGLREELRGRNPNAKLMNDAYVDRVIRFQDTANAAQQRAANLRNADLGPTNPDMAERYDAREFRARQAAQSALNRPNVPQQSAQARTAEAAANKTAQELKQRIDMLEKAGPLPDNAQATLDDLKARYDDMRGKAAISGADREPSAVAQDLNARASAETPVGKAKAAVKETVGAAMNKGKEVLGDAVDAVKAKGPEVAARAAEAVTDVAEKGVDAAKAAGTTAKNAAEDFAGGVKEGFSQADSLGTTRDAGETVGKAAKEGVDAVKEGAARGAEAVKEGAAKGAATARRVADKGASMLDTGLRTAAGTARTVGRAIAAPVKLARAGVRNPLGTVGVLSAGGEAAQLMEQGVAGLDVPEALANQAVTGMGQTANETAARLSALGATSKSPLEDQFIAAARGAKDYLYELPEIAGDAIGAAWKAATTDKTWGQTWQDAKEERGYFGRKFDEADAATLAEMRKAGGPDFDKFLEKFRGMGKGNEAAQGLNSAWGLRTPEELAATNPDAPRGRQVAPQNLPARAVTSEGEPVQASAIGGMSPGERAAFGDAQGAVAPPGGAVAAQAMREGPRAGTTQALPADGPAAGWSRTQNQDGTTDYTNGRGSYVNGVRRRGDGGTFNTMSGPGGPADPNDIQGSIQRNVAAYDRASDAVRAVTDTARALRGAGAAGSAAGAASTGKGYAETGFGLRQAMKNAAVGKPAYDANLTPRQNAARLQNWQAGRDQELIDRGINPNTGERYGSAPGKGTGAGATLRDQIAAAQLQRQSIKDNFDMMMKTEEFQKGLNDSERAYMGEMQKQIASEDPAVRRQGMFSALQAYEANPNGPGGRLALQMLGTLAPAEVQDERGVIDWVRGMFMGGEYKAVQPTADPGQAQALLDQAQPGGNMVFGPALDFGGGNYTYRASNPELYDFGMAMHAANQRRGLR